MKPVETTYKRPISPEKLAHRNTLIFGVWFSSSRLITGSFTFAFLLSQGLSVTDVSIARSFQLVLLLLLDVPAGVIADKIGKNRTVIFGALVSTIWLALLWHTDSFALLLASEAANALSLALFGGSFEMLLRDNDKSGRNPFAKLTFYQYIFIALGSLFGSGIANFVGMDTAWALAVTSQALLTTWSLFSIRKNTGHMERARKKRSIFIALSSLKRIDYRIILLFCFSTVSYEAILMFWQPVLEQYGYTLTNFLGLGAVFFGLIVVQALGGLIYEKLENFVFLLITTTVIVGLIVWKVAEGREVTLIAIVWIVLFCLVAKILTIKALGGLTRQVVGDDETQVFSWIATMARLLTAVAIYLIGISIDNLSQARLTIPILCALLLVTAICIRKETKITND